MYKVMPVDPGPDGTYAGVDAVPPDADEQAPFEIIFRVPRLEGHEEEDRRHYTIVLPRYAAEELRQQAQGEDEQDAGRAPRAALAPCSMHCKSKETRVCAPRLGEAPASGALCGAVVVNRPPPLPPHLPPPPRPLELEL